MQLRLGEINLHVSDLDRSARFYSEAFGFEECGRDEHWSKVRNGDVTLVLFAAPAAAPCAAVGPHHGMTADLLVAEVEDAHRRVVAAGGKIVHAVEEAHGGFFICADPDGIRWEVIGTQ